MVGEYLGKVENTGRFEPCGKRNCQVCDFLCDIETILHCGKAFKIKSVPHYVNYQKVVYLTIWKERDHIKP